MSTTDSFSISDSSAALALADQAKAEAQRQAATPYFTPHGMPSQRQEVFTSGGVITSATVHDKSFGVPTGYANQGRPGFISVPGMGETTVEAAKAAGLIPHTWKEGDALPFDQARDAATKGNGTGTQEDTQKAPDQGNKDQTTVAEHRVKVAGEILDSVDKAYGSALTDEYISRAVESGDIPEEGLPPGFTPTMAMQVYQGYVAQADAVLAPVGASVSLLQEMLNPDELRTARQATMAGMKDDLSRLGQVALERLSRLPQTDPEGFMDMVNSMDPKERKAIRHDRHTGEWRVTVPGKPEMSFGAAVAMGLVRV